MFNFITNTVETTVAELVSSEATTEAVKEAVEIGFTKEFIGEAALCSAAGMVGIFIVIGIIILSVSLLNKSNNKKEK